LNNSSFAVSSAKLIQSRAAALPLPLRNRTLYALSARPSDAYRYASASHSVLNSVCVLPSDLKVRHLFILVVLSSSKRKR
jgi:hypothetical protein